jgi:hypothetical protein
MVTWQNRTRVLRLDHQGAFFAPARITRQIMGMFDTIIFDRPIPCPKCGAAIRSDQTKAFECTLDDYRIGDTFGRPRRGDPHRRR